MRQLSSLDQQFLAIEDGRTHGHVSGLGIYDPSTAPGGALTLDTIAALIRSRLDRLAPFRWRLAEVPFGLDRPYWFDDGDVDLDFHLRELALPAPGDERRLTEQVARIVGRPLDRSRPLWELYLIHGLADGRVAVLTKIHHAAVDGMSGAEVMSALLDPAPEPAPKPTPACAPRSKKPGSLELLARGLAGVPRQPLRSLRSAVRVLPHLGQVPTIRSVPGVSRQHAPRTSLNTPIGPHRRVALSRQSLADVKQIKDHFGVTVNDVVMAICAGALRSWLDAQGELPDAPLLAMVPVSVRTPEQFGTFGNRVATMLASLPTDVADPADRLAAAHAAMREAKDRHQAVPPTVLEDANDVIPPALFTRAAQLTTSLLARHPREAPVNTVVSNVPGSPVPLYMAGARLEALYPVSAIMHGVGLNITVMSYCGGLDFGIVADRDMIDDPWPLAAALAEAQAELLACTRAARATCTAMTTNQVR